MTEKGPGERVNPLVEENRQKIIHAWPRLQGAIARVRGEVPLGEKDPLLLRYATFAPINLGEPIRVINTDIYEQIDEWTGDSYARGQYVFHHDATGIIAVTFGIDADKHRQSQGYGSGLFGIVNEVILDSLSRFRYQLGGEVVVGGIRDEATGLGGALRDRWTSDQVRKLGYTLDQETGIWYKTYQGSRKKIEIADISAFKHSSGRK
ncbi:MAG: hypothetical protein ACM3IJ_03140 [Candidatus Levyibacteriota bacterium]